MKWIENRHARMIAGLVLILLFGACGSTKESGKTTVTTAYSGLDFEFIAEVKVFHASDDTSTLFVKIDTEKLLYSRAATKNFAARVQVEIVANPIGESGMVSTKKTFQLLDEDNEKKAKSLLAATGIALKRGHKYNISLNIIDLNRKNTLTQIVEADKTNHINRQNFLVLREHQKVPIFNDRITEGSTYHVQYNAPDSTNQLTVKYYNREFPLPPPPFAFYEPKGFDYEADSLFTVQLNAENQFTLTSASRGFYHIQSDPDQKSGLSLFITAPEFPEVKNVQNMIDPFRYLVSGKEYRQILDAENQKDALEQTWVDWTGNRERARSSITSFYERVEEANHYFSSHVEGWKSDRGVIYIVYGKPNKVYRTPLIETWIYGEENNPMSITFNFIRVINPFTDNDYRLNREDYYKPSWYRAIESWRNGRIF